MLDRDEDLSEETRVLLLCVSVALVIFSGLCAGLTLGLLSLDKVDLEVIKRSGTPYEIWLVERVEPVVSRPHYLLATLLLCNAAAMEALPLFLDRLLNPVAAILLSVTAILIFGEIVPQAVCKRYGLQVGAYLAWFVRFLMLATAAITWPIGKLLDWVLGEESALFKRRELKALVSMHAEPAEDGEQSTLTLDEAQVIQGALDMASKTAEAAMTPLAKVFALSTEAEINDELLLRILERGHSRLPVYEGENKQNIVGLVLVKELLLVDEDAGVKVRDLRLRELAWMSADTMLYDVLKVFRYGRSHMACLTKGRSEVAGRLEVVGLITIEDVLEELLQQEIVDETDQYVDNLQTVKTNTLQSLQQLPANLRRFLTRSIVLTAPERERAGRSQHGGGTAAASVGAAAAAGIMAGTSQEAVGTLAHSPGAVAAAAAAGALVAACRAGGSSAAVRQQALAQQQGSGSALTSPVRVSWADGGGAAAPAAAGGGAAALPGPAVSLAGQLLTRDKPPVPRRTSSSRSLRGRLADLRRHGSDALQQPLLESDHEGEGSGQVSWRGAAGAAGEAAAAAAEQHRRRQREQIAEMLRGGQAAGGAEGSGGGNGASAEQHLEQLLSSSPFGWTELEQGGEQGRRRSADDMV